MQFLLFIILPLALSKDAKQKLCSTSNCRKCDSYLSVANPHINSIPKTSKLLSFDCSICMTRGVIDEKYYLPGWKNDQNIYRSLKMESEI